LFRVFIEQIYRDPLWPEDVKDYATDAIQNGR